MSDKVKNTSEPEVHEISSWNALLLWPLSLVLRLWNASLRIKTGNRSLEIVQGDPRPRVLVLWHNCLFPAGSLYHRYRLPNTVHPMISSSKDGAYLAMFFKFLGMGSIRGSTKTRSVAALKEAIKVIRNGNDIAITPDGSRGPIYYFNPGAAAVAKIVKAPVLLVGFRFHSSWRLKSWDRLHLPKPFSTVEVVMEQYDDLHERMSVEEMVDFLRGRLMVLNGLDADDQEVESVPDTRF